MDENKRTVSFNATVSRSPASLIKVIPAWVALEILGPSFTWKTEIYTLGPIENGTLDGDLLIKGYGDPYLIIEDLWQIVRALSQKGLKHINGNLLIDSTYFDTNQSDRTPIDGDPLRLYNVTPNATMVNFKWVEFVLNPANDEKTVKVTTNPRLPNLKIINAISLTNNPCRGNNPNIRLQIASDDLGTIKMSGELPRSCRNYTLSRTALSHEAYLFGLFKHLLQQSNGSINGQHLSVGSNLSTRNKVFYEWDSKPLLEILPKINKWSNNLMTRSLVYSIGADLFGAPGTEKKGTSAIKKYMRDQGMNILELHIENGSGLSRSTHATAETINEVLRKAWRSQLMPEFLASLSIAGKDGTTRNRFRNQTINNRVRIKTGTLKNVSSGGGYVFAKSGKVFSVVFIANHPGVEKVTGPKFQEALMTWVTEL